MQAVPLGRRGGRQVLFCTELLMALASGCSGVAAGRGQVAPVAFRCKVGCAYSEVVLTATLILVKGC